MLYTLKQIEEMIEKQVAVDDLPDLVRFILYDLLNSLDASIICEQFLEE